MVIVEDKRVLTIDFDLTADFNFTNDLGAGSIKQEAGSTNVDDYVMACKCGGPEASPATRALFLRTVGFMYVSGPWKRMWGLQPSTAW